ncbi:family 10 glycosylhydrolase [Candidatus Sumerlaeota bacterium]|nr:family 10 glycosylhydrolase [Candidatus Sumerlaeota bacterium]
MHRESLKLIVFLCAICAIFAMSCQTPPHTGRLDPYETGEPHYELRAVWASRFNYKTPEDVRAIVKNLKEYNFNVLVFQVRGNGTVFYRSELEPWSEMLGGKDPGWDPLQLAIDECHRAGIELHAWINVFPAWRGTTPPPWKNQLWNAHRDWFMIPKERRGKPPQLQSGYSFISPGNPEVKHYLEELVAELVSHYEIDGLHFDYIRYPGPEYSYDDASIREFKHRFGKDPEELPAEWREWRREQVTEVVARCYRRAKSLRPRIKVSAAVFGNYKRSSYDYFQDSHSWLQYGILDFTFPMIYRIDPAVFKKYAVDHIVNSHQRYSFPGLGTYLMKDTPEPMIEQISIVHKLKSRGMIFFDYASLFPEHKPGRMAEALLKGPFAKPAPLPSMPWLASSDDDVVGPIITDVSINPPKILAGGNFTVECTIKDPSGVCYSPGKGGLKTPWLNVLKQKWSPEPEILTTIELKRKRKYLLLPTHRFYTPKPIPVPSGMDKIYLQIFAYDNDRDKKDGGNRDRSLGSSEVIELPVFRPPVGFAFEREIGPRIKGAQYSAVDKQGKLWVCSWSEDAIYVLLPNGIQTDISPITKALDESNNVVNIRRPRGIAITPGNIVLVSNGEGNLLLRFSAINGKPLKAFKLGFLCGDIDVDENGYIYATEIYRRKWHKLTPDGKETSPQPYSPFSPENVLFGSPNLNRGIAVTKDGNLVYIANEGGNRVDVYKRQKSQDGESYVFIKDIHIPVGDYTGAVDVAPDGRLFVSDGDGMVKVCSADGTLQTMLWRYDAQHQGYPRGVVFSRNGKTLYIIQTGRFAHPASIEQWRVLK